MESLFKRSQPKTDLSEVNMLIHGLPKTGKTSTAAQMKSGNKEPLFIATEDGHHSLNVLVESVSNWPAFKLLVAKLEKNKDAVKAQCSCLVIDLLSDLDQWCDDYVCTELKIKNLGDLDFGRGYSAKKKEMQATLSRLFAILPIKFITHTKEKEVEFEGVKVDMYQPNLSGSTLEYVNGKVDIIGFITPDHKSKKTFITFRPTKFAVAGTRFPHLATEFELNPTNMSESYTKINESFINKQ